MSAPVNHLQERLLDPDDSISKIMPAAIALAMMLRQRTMAAWLRTEYEGYPEGAAVLPYRQDIAGHIVARSPQYGWIPAPVSAQQNREHAHLDLREGMTALEQVCQGSKKGSGNKIPIPAEAMTVLQAQINLSAELAIIVGRDAYCQLIRTVRSAVYLWTQELIASGVGGEHNSFTDAEKAQAAHLDQPETFWKRAMAEEGNLPVPDVRSAGFFERMFGRTA